MIERLRALTPPDTILASGVGQHQMWASQHWKFNHPYTWVNSGGLGTMGFAVPAAIGAKVGRPDRMVWAVDGDGCFQMTAQELVTATAERIPVKIAILNNAYLGMVRQWQEMFYDERYSEVYLSPDLPDYVKWAEAMGCVAIRVEDTDEIEPAIEKANHDQRPAGRRRVPHRRPGEGVPDGAGRAQQRRDRGRPQPGGRAGARAPAPGGCAMSGSTAASYHTLVVLVENKPGVLARVASLFARRGFNIHSLAVAPTDDDRFSRITIVADTASAPLEQITKQLYKLINVVKINELSPADSVERELLMATREGAVVGPGPGPGADPDLRGPGPQRRRHRADGQPGRHAGQARRLRGAAAALRHRRHPAHRPGGPAQAGAHRRRHAPPPRRPPAYAPPADHTRTQRSSVASQCGNGAGSGFAAAQRSRAAANLGPSDDAGHQDLRTKRTGQVVTPAKSLAFSVTITRPSTAASWIERVVREVVSTQQVRRRRVVPCRVEKLGDDWREHRVDEEPQASSRSRSCATRSASWSARSLARMRASTSSRFGRGVRSRR